MKTFKQYIDETYRITPKRRELLKSLNTQAQRAGSEALRNPNTIQGMNTLMHHSARQARIDAIFNMGLPIEHRKDLFGDVESDKSLKDAMKNARATEKATGKLINKVQ